MFRSKNPYWTFGEIMDMEEKLGVRSTFFFLNETGKASLLKPSSYALYWGRYSLDEKDVRDIIAKLDAGGWEIGLHGSYRSYDNERLLSAEKDKLEKIVGHGIAGVRQHYLRLSIPDTWAMQKRLGFSYDASYGHSDAIGAKDGMLSIFSPIGDGFDVVPLSLMDSALFEMHPNTDEAWTHVRDLIADAKKCGGLFSVLWHTERFNSDEFPGHADFYQKLVEFCMEEGAWVGTCGEAVKLAGS
jgi:peptidoglycan/xylan/chitin deacetylase (PgdA/CDA1 family)